jgi:hypothetical protein
MLNWTNICIIADVVWLGDPDHIGILNVDGKLIEDAGDDFQVGDDGGVFEFRGELLGREKNVVDDNFDEDKADEGGYLEIGVGWNVVEFLGNASKFKFFLGQEGLSAWVVAMPAEMVEHLGEFLALTGIAHPLADCL